MAKAEPVFRSQGRTPLVLVNGGGGGAGLGKDRDGVSVFLVRHDQKSDFTATPLPSALSKPCPRDALGLGNSDKFLCLCQRGGLTWFQWLKAHAGVPAPQPAAPFCPRSCPAPSPHTPTTPNITQLPPTQIHLGVQQNDHLHCAKAGRNHLNIDLAKRVIRVFL